MRTGQLDGGLAAPAGWREPQPAAQPVRSRPQLAEWQSPAAVKPAPQAAPTVQPDDNSDDGELPPGLTTTAWLSMRHLMSVARKVVADPASVSYVPEAESEQPQLVVTPSGFRYAERFSWLEIRR